MSELQHRLPPHSIEAEQGVLSCMLQDPQQVIPECATAINAESFYDLRHQVIYSAIVEMWDEQKPVDLVTLHQNIKDRDLLEEVGSIAYLSLVADFSPSAANSGYFLGILKEKYVLRQLSRAATEIQVMVSESTDDVSVTLDRSQALVVSISNSQSDEGQTIKDLIKKSIANIEVMHQNKGALTGIATGFADFDKLTNGLQSGEMIVIAARPSVGKTSLAMCIAEHVAVDQGIPVGVFSLEMTAESLTQRLLLSRSRCNIQNIRAGLITERDFPRITSAAGKLSSSKLHIDDTSGLSILQLRSRARRMFQRYGIKLFVIDYLQLLHSTSKKADNRQQEIADISNGIKSMAKELNVPVIVLAQLNREIEKDKLRKPRLSDLRESGSIEQDSDVVGLLYKVQAEDADPNAEAIPVNLLIAKQRNGPAGDDVPLTFLKPFTRFESRSHFEEPERYEQPHWTDK